MQRNNNKKKYILKLIQLDILVIFNPLCLCENLLIAELKKKNKKSYMR